MHPAFRLLPAAGFLAGLYACAALYGAGDVPTPADAGASADGAGESSGGSGSGSSSGSGSGSSNGSSSGSSSGSGSGASNGGSSGSGGGADAGPSDAGDAMPADAPDAGESDAGADAGSDGGFVCPSADSTVVFCSGFDRGTTAPWDWASAPTTAKGADATDTTTFLSAPNAFAASAGLLLPSDTDTLAYVGEPFTTLAGRIDYGFHAYVKAYDASENPSVPIAQLVLGPSTTGAFSMQLVLKAGKVQLTQIFIGADGGVQTPTVDVTEVATGEWEAFDLVLDRRTASWTVNVLVNGTSQLLAEAAQTPAQANAEIDLGILGLLPPSNATAITFDNVVVRAY